MAALRTPEEKRQIVEHCIDIEMAGGSVIDYLAAKGYATPRATWANIQKRYLGRTGDKITEEKATHRKRKGKRPQIREDALESDRNEYDRIHGLEHNPEDGEQKTDGCMYTETEPPEQDGPVYLLGPTFGTIPEELIRKKPEPEDPEIIATRLVTCQGIWELDGTSIVFKQAGNLGEISLPMEGWEKLTKDFPKICSMMGVR